VTDPVEEKNPYSTMRIETAVYDTIADEQARLRRVERKKVSYSEILRRMWAAYRAMHKKPPQEPEATQALQQIPESAKPSPVEDDPRLTRCIRIMREVLQEANTPEMIEAYLLCVDLISIGALWLRGRTAAEVRGILDQIVEAREKMKLGNNSDPPAAAKHDTTSKQFGT
jgi:hypothetical protein